jgi:hypothetical protein
VVENNGNGLNYCNTFPAQEKKKKMKKKKRKVMRLAKLMALAHAHLSLPSPPLCPQIGNKGKCGTSFYKHMHVANFSYCQLKQR